MTSSSMKSKLKSLIRKSDGNFAMMAALVVPVLFMAGSLALDTTNGMSMKIRLQNAVDSAALATATRLYQEEDLSLEDAKAFAAKFLEGQVQEDFPAYSNMTVAPTVTITPETKNGRTIWHIAISMSGTQALTPMARVLGQDSLTVDVVGKSVSAGETQGSISMALVLDKSGSMGWDLPLGSGTGDVVDPDDILVGPDGLPLASADKMTILKIAVNALVAQFETADPERKYIRLGASSYDYQLQGTQDLRWKPSKTGDFVNSLSAGGGTDSTDAFGWAYAKLMKQSENTKHENKSGQMPKKFIVFMTDGSNNYSSADSSTKKLCNDAKADDIVIYSVAFAAPDAGKALLSYCASTSEHYYDATSSAQLIQAFKNIGQEASTVVSRLTE